MARKKKQKVHRKTQARENSATVQQLLATIPDPQVKPFELHGLPHQSTISTLQTRQITLRSKGSFEPGTVRGAQSPQRTTVSPGDLLEIELDGGIRTWMNGAEFHNRFASRLSRSTTVQSLAAPPYLPDDEASLKTREVFPLAIKSLKVFEAELANTTARQIGESIDHRIALPRRGEGLYLLNLETEHFALRPLDPDVFRDAKQILLFIHGTLSCTSGTFGDLWSQDRAKELTRLRELYGDCVLGFDHPTLTVSPVENALILAQELGKWLPANATIHIVSHSRGGLVGELLCRDDNANLEAAVHKNVMESSHFQNKFALLNAELQKRHFTVTRFVRVACPALGTTLVSGRLDRWLSVIGSVCSAAPPGTPLAEMFGDICDFIAAAIHERTDPKTLPGLEAMMPESALIRCLNSSTSVPGDLTVIAGAIEPSTWWANLFTWLTDRHYDGDHDLVVNSQSMYGGVPRSSTSLLSFHRGTDVHHFNYFKNSDSAKHILQALASHHDDVTGFQPLPTPASVIARDVARSIGTLRKRETQAVTKRETRQSNPVRVWVAHGNLAFATYPVVVGHYGGDTIVSAEKYLDHELDGALTRRSSMGLYPGEIETSAVFINSTSDNAAEKTLKGAVVAGLGKVGALTKSSLARTVAHAMLDYVLKCKEVTRTDNKKNSAPEYGMTCLLIGTGAGGVTVSDSIFAILEGVTLANTKLASANQPSRIHEIEFVELWQDVAHLAAKTLLKFQKENRFADMFELRTELLTRNGGRYRVSASEDTQWWHRLQILGATQGESQGTLRFASLTKRARNEVRLHATERALVDNFIERTISTTRDDRGIAHTLFELLLPNAIKDQAPDRDNLVLVVDEEAARYPWELLDDPKNTTGPPLSTSRGLLRQLESLTFRETVREVTEPNALVVGDPESDALPLPAAVEEAHAVATALSNKKMFDVTSCIRSRAKEILTSLFGRPYKVLHLAGHGTYEKRGNGASPIAGMLLSDGLLLSPKTVSQMRNVPELVFINCCHLGHIESVPPKNLVHFAANVATEFIRMGVKAVVAAGWAVDDSAAATFASRFYGEMLNGQPFGIAVMKAREAAYNAYPECNTWGAYQCYGDPDYRFLESRGAQSEWRPSYVAQSEAIAEIENIAGDLSTRASRGIDWQMKQLQTIEQVLKKDYPQWCSSGRIAASLGNAFIQAREFKTAADYFAKASSQEDGAMTVRDIERWSNAQVRYAFDLAAARQHQPKALALIDEAIARLERLQPVSSHTNAIIASAFKRKAMIGGRERLPALDLMRHHYERAYLLAKEKNAETAYPLLNLAFAEVALSLQKDKALGSRSEYFKLLQETRPHIEKMQRSKRDFWSAIDLVMLEFLSHLADASLSGEKLEHLAGKCKELRKKASPREFDSVLDQLDFLAAMAEKQKQVAKHIVELRKMIS